MQEGVKCHQNTDQQIGKFKNWNSCVHKIYCPLFLLNLRFVVLLKVNHKYNLFT